MKRYKKNIDMEISKIIKTDFSSVKKKIINNEGEILNMKKQKRNPISIAKLLAMPTAALAVFMIVFINGGNTSSLIIDVNPGIKMSVKKDNVKELIALNKDAEKIIKNIDYKNEDVKDVTEDILEEMIKQGYITKENNSLLISNVDHDNNKLQEEVKKYVQNFLNKNNINPAIISQEIDDKLEDEAEKYDISIGKATLINKIIKSDPRYTYDMLKDLNTNNLSLIANNIKNTTFSGETNSSYISESEALNTVLKDLSTIKSNLKDLEIELEYENQMVYEIEFELNGYEYEYVLNANDSSIIEIEKDLDNDKDSDNDDDNDDFNDDNDSDDDNDNDSDDDNDDNDNDNDSNDDNDDLDDDNDDLDDDNDDLDDDNDKDSDDDNDDSDDDNDNDLDNDSDDDNDDIN